MNKNIKIVTKSPEEAASPVELPKKMNKLLFLKLSLVVLFLCGALAGGFTLLYRDRALPNVQVGAIRVGQRSHDELKQLAAEQQALLQVTFFDDKKSATIPAKDLGVTINSEETARRALQARSLMLWKTEQIGLVLKTDPGILKHYIQTHYPTLYVDPQDAQLTYNAAAKQFDIKPGVPGKGFDVAWFESQLSDLALNPRNLALRLQTTPTEPIITEASLQKVQKAANEQIKLPLTFSANGQPVYVATSDDISNFMHFTPDIQKRTVVIEFDKAKIEQFLAQKVAAIIAQPPVDRKVIVDKQTGSQFVVSEGRSGQQIQDSNKIADEVLTALTQRQPLTKELSITYAPFKTVTLEGSSHWIEIDLSEQRLIMYVDQTPLRSFLISSGTARTPTPIGTFRVHYKTPSQTMTGGSASSGDYYYLPNVKWVSYFAGEAAIHGAYWHNNFGHPMSHGCINMTESAAKIIYDFAPIGTRVVVHG
ncbi:MAG TPA: L,D-transpeptidase family protein [Candidatus Saccharimonadales bacterium]